MAKSCCECGRSLKNMILSNGDYYCQPCYKYFVKEGRERHELPQYGEVTYDEEGRPICHFCGMSHNKVLSHARYFHDIDAKGYKEKFGLDATKGIMSRKSKEIARERNLENYSKVVKNNLIKGGKNTRFTKGSKGRTRDQVREQTRRRLVENMPKGRGRKHYDDSN